MSYLEELSAVTACCAGDAPQAGSGLAAIIQVGLNTVQNVPRCCGGTPSLCREDSFLPPHAVNPPRRTFNDLLGDRRHGDTLETHSARCRNTTYFAWRVTLKMPIFMS